MKFTSIAFIQIPTYLELTASLNHFYGLQFPPRCSDTTTEFYSVKPFQFQATSWVQSNRYVVTASYELNIYMKFNINSIVICHILHHFTSITLPPSIPQAIICLQVTFTRWTSGRCRGTQLPCVAIKISLSIHPHLPASSSSSYFFSLLLFPSQFSEG